MSRWIRAALVGVVLLAGVAFAGWRWLTAREPVPETTDYVLDLARVRALATSLPGPLPLAVHSEEVATAELPRAAVFAGASFEPHPMVHQVFQIRWDDRFVLVDAAFSEAKHAEMGGGTYREEGWRRVQRALPLADAIWITHEHADHLEGAARVPQPEVLLGRLRLTREQLANGPRLDEVAFPEVLRRSLEPLSYERYLAAAPGVVLIRAAGHTPGSQIVYVQRRDGRELLLLGDVVWHLDAVRRLHYRPRLVTDLFLREDRGAVLAEIRRLHQLLGEAPELRQVPSHDQDVRRALLEEGLLEEGLVLPAPSVAGSPGGVSASAEKR